MHFRHIIKFITIILDSSNKQCLYDGCQKSKPSIVLLNLFAFDIYLHKTISFHISIFFFLSLIWVATRRTFGCQPVWKSLNANTMYFCEIWAFPEFSGLEIVWQISFAHRPMYVTKCNFTFQKRIAANTFFVCQSRHHIRYLQISNHVESTITGFSFADGLIGFFFVGSSHRGDKFNGNCGWWKIMHSVYNLHSNSAKFFVTFQCCTLKNSFAYVQICIFIWLDFEKEWREKEESNLRRFRLDLVEIKRLYAGCYNCAQERVCVCVWACRRLLFNLMHCRTENI